MVPSQAPYLKHVDENWRVGTDAKLISANLIDATLTGTNFTDATWIDGTKK